MTMARLIIALLCALGMAQAFAADIRLAAGGAVKSAVSPLVDAFAKETGHDVKMDFAPMGVLSQRVLAGETIDLLIMTPEALEPLERAGRVIGASRTALGQVGIGVVVNEHAPVPDISTPEALKQTLLRAKSLVYIDPERGTSGKHFAQVLDKLGIAQEMKPKTTLGTGGYVVEPVGRGEIEIGVHQISEILPVKGVKLIGPLPGNLQKLTTYVAAVSANAQSPDVARALIAYLSSGSARAAFANAGFTAP